MRFKRRGVPPLESHRHASSKIDTVATRLTHCVEFTLLWEQPSALEKDWHGTPPRDYYLICQVGYPPLIDSMDSGKAHAVQKLVGGTAPLALNYDGFHETHGAASETVYNIRPSNCSFLFERGGPVAYDNPDASRQGLGTVQSRMLRPAEHNAPTGTKVRCIRVIITLATVIRAPIYKVQRIAFTSTEHREVIPNSGTFMQSIWTGTAEIEQQIAGSASLKCTFNRVTDYT
ncbi:hypothetical protein BT96DRAFT_998270 [Gymnopus androsaceus JB14]|uniref:Uncharacterized protein n=1 Tax=Gymnopus androsaceus JB14 TaxID=1447944 RepID=A0A6A4HAM4_9AGAR|nr:hypothetical protein BT96DRAFT_998270 [Gymnopus androsaceus JB14]